VPLSCVARVGEVGTVVGQNGVDQVVTIHLKAKPPPLGRASPRDISKARLIAQAAKEVSTRQLVGLKIGILCNMPTLHSGTTFAWWLIVIGPLFNGLLDDVPIKILRVWGR
jgi:hypothetical protein